MLIELVDRARRRYLCNEILAQGAWAVSAAMGAIILLLLLGTQILEWHWLILLPLATLGAGVWRTTRRLPSCYAIARIVDARLGLSDTLSTALYFSDPSRAARISMPVREAQWARADRLSGTVDAREAIPFTLPRAVYSMAVLAVAATSLFALRYGLERRLDLTRPLARVIQQALGLEEQQLAALDKKKDPPPKPANTSELEGFSIDGANLPEQIEASEISSLENTGAPQAAAQQNNSRQGNKNLQGLSLGEDSEGGEGEGGEGMEASEGDAGEQGQQGSSPTGQPGQKAAPNESGGNPGNNSSLLAKFRDAMQNLLSRMGQQPAGASGAQQSAQGQNNRQGQKAGAKQGGAQGQQQGQETAQDGQGQDSQMAQNASGRGRSDGSEEQSTRQPGSGIGRQDGHKDVKLAEQLKAMGKISELIGKRAANVSGEVTMEVQSNNQQLQTPYSRRSATHGEAAAEIGRDEVPMALQAYVQQYFEQVRKQTGK